MLHLYAKREASSFQCRPTSCAWLSGKKVWVAGCRAQLLSFGQSRASDAQHLPKGFALFGRVVAAGFGRMRGSCKEPQGSVSAGIPLSGSQGIREYPVKPTEHEPLGSSPPAAVEPLLKTPHFSMSGGLVTNAPPPLPGCCLLPRAAAGLNPLLSFLLSLMPGFSQTKNTGSD